MTRTVEDLRADETSFEDAQHRLEEVIHDLEGGDMGLQRSLDTFAEGMALATYCQEILRTARRRVEEIVEEAEAAQSGAAGDKGDGGQGPDEG